MKAKAPTPTQLVQIDLGTPLQIQLGQLNIRKDGTLVGSRPGKYLLIRMESGTDFNRTGLNNEGTSLVVRYISRGNVYAFKSSVINTIHRPELLLAIYYPSQVEIVELRNDRRIRCFLPTQLIFDGEVLEGSLVDISRSGGQFHITPFHRVRWLLDQMEQSLEVAIKLPGVSGSCNIIGNMRNVHAAEGGIEIGLHFERMDHQNLKKLICFLLEANALPEYEQLSQLILQHHCWRQRAFYYLYHDRDSLFAQDFEISPDECHLGQWLNREGKSLFAGSGSFQELDRAHRALHREVEKAVRLRKSGDHPGAVAMIRQINVDDLSPLIAALIASKDKEQQTAS